jgi:spore germination cell wall hydrolase CwlJ-like protein
MELTTRTLTSVLGLFLVAILVHSIMTFKYNDVNSIKHGEIQTVAQMKKDLDCLALNIYREAGYEPVEGRIAVAQVTLNRVAHPDFPKSVCEVVQQKSLITGSIICQFSWYCDSVHRARPINKEVYGESYEVAKKVMLEKFRLPGLHDALYYHADYVNPKWKLERIEKIGRHIFYKPKGESHPKLAGA